MTDDENLLDAKEVAKLLNIHWRTVQRMAKRGELPAYIVARQYRFKRSDIEDYLEKHRFTPPQDDHPGA